MGAIISIARKFEELPIVRQLSCFIFGSNSTMDEMEEEFEEFQPFALSVNSCEVSESMTSILDQIMMILAQPDITIVGVYGSSKARKSNVVEKITRRVTRDGVFDVILKASVTKKPDLRRIQEELGTMLGLQLVEKTLEGRATRLCERIKKEEKILIILDDLWGGINWGRIGIPFGNDHKGSKILLLSHSQEVLSDQMNTQIEISV